MNNMVNRVNDLAETFEGSLGGALANEADVAELIFDVVPGVMRVLRHVMRTSADSELSIPQLRILSHVNRGMSKAASLAELQGVSLAAISKMVDALESRGLVAREHRGGNRKQLFIQLTPRGRALFKKTREAAQKAITEVLERASERERAKIFSGLSALHGAFDASGILPGERAPVVSVGIDED